MNTERDYPLGPGDNDNYGNLCIRCDLPFRGKHTCRECSEELDAMTPEEQDAVYKAKLDELLT